MTDTRSAARGWRPAALSFAGLWALAVAQPLFDLLARQPEALVAQQLSGARLILWALGASLVPPLAMATAFALLHRLHPRLGATAAFLAIGGVASLMALLVVRRLLPQAPVAVAVSLVVGVGVALVARRPAPRTLLSFLSLAALVCPLLFLAQPSLRSLLRSADVDIVASGLDPDAVAAGAPVVMVLLDELPLVSLLAEDGTINAARYPHFARLARTAHWFPNATTVSHSTAYAVPAILSGRYPDEKRLPVVNDYPQNLFTALAGGGYAMAVTEPHTDLCPPDLCTTDPTTQAGPDRRVLLSDLAIVYGHLVVPEGWRHRLPTVGESWSHFGALPETPTPATAGPQREASETGDAKSTKPRGFTPPGKHRVAKAKRQLRRAHAERPADAFRSFVRDIRPRETPTLHFLHVMLPHMPWRYLPDGRRYEPTSAPREPHGLINQVWKGTPFEVLQGQQRHLLQLALTDRLIGELIDHLESVDLFDRSVLVLVADHGASFVPDQLRRNLTKKNIADITNVPLFLKLPGQQRGTRDDGNVETIDLLPTLASALGVRLPSPVDGRDLLGSTPPRSGKRTFRSGLAGSGPGRPLDYDVATLEDQRRVRLTANRQTFGTDPHDVYAFGPYGAWVGRRLATFTVGRPQTAWTARLEQDDALRSIDPEAEVVPARLTGSLRAVDPETAVAPQRLAVVVDDVVRAVTETYTTINDRNRFSAVIDPQALTRGAIDVRLFAVEGPRGNATLRPLGRHEHEQLRTFEATFESQNLRGWTYLRSKGRTQRLAR